MPMYNRIKIASNKLPMVQPGTRDNSILPSSGGASNSGITLDYSAINMGGVDNGVAINHVDDSNDNDFNCPKCKKNLKLFGKLIEHLKEQHKLNASVARAYAEHALKEKQEQAEKRRLKLEEDEKEMAYQKELKSHETRQGIPVQGIYKIILSQRTRKSIERGLLDPFTKFNLVVWKKDTEHGLDEPFYEIPENGIVKVLESKTSKRGTILLVIETNDGIGFVGWNSANDMWDFVPPSNSADDSNAKANGSFVGSREEGFEFRHSLDYGSTASFSQHVIKIAFPDYVIAANHTDDKPKVLVYDPKKDGLGEWLFDAIAQSNKNNKQWVPINGLNEYQLRAIGIRKERNGKQSEFASPGFQIKGPDIQEYYLDVVGLSFDSRYAIAKFIQNQLDWPKKLYDSFGIYLAYPVNASFFQHVIKIAFPDYQQYNSNSQMYEQISEKTDYLTTPHFNMWNTYYTDDAFTCKRCNFTTNTESELSNHINENHSVGARSNRLIRLFKD